MPGIEDHTFSVPCLGNLRKSPGREIPAANPAAHLPHSSISAAVFAEKLRGWGVLFDGQSDPVHFIERIEEGATAYNVRTSDIPRAVIGLLSGRAEGCFRAYQMHTEPWETFRREFLEFFLPPRYYQSLEDAIRTRQQQVGELFKIYVVELRLMMQRAKYSLDQELERIYENLMPE